MKPLNILVLNYTHLSWTKVIRERIRSDGRVFIDQGRFWSADEEEGLLARMRRVMWYCHWTNNK